MASSNRPDRPLARRSLLGAGAALGGAAVIGSLGPAAQAAGTGERPSWPRQFPLPNGWRPEGVTIGRTPHAYFGSIAHGSVYRVDLATGRGRTVVQGQGADHPVIGLKILGSGDLLLCGGGSSELRIADPRTGEQRTLATVDGVFVNDVIPTPGAAWFTDSYEPQLYRLALDRHQRPGGVTTVPLTGDWVQGPEFTANGIERTPDGTALLVVNSYADGGTLMRVDPASGRAKAVDLGGAKIPNGDGLLLLGRTLYCVQQQQNAIDVFALNKAGTKGRSIARITDPARFRIPTTAAAWGRRLYLPNARFDVPDPGPDTTYDAVAVDQV
ncbi:SMP-30/gluconolactonase/LRE family protein [Streptomyces indicus]|uniref:Sugar lactone lactonase YvrE n=1 Tax=Streptomyces indicus TaxID=417292 RepID=A0A1G8XQ94_9ACTN|nr:superoxide dismutase [Streptomyces indicus]SDJ92663.1 Sugar lactone lactonase YvrE [Streptomyces indicus]